MRRQSVMMTGVALIAAAAAGCTPDSATVVLDPTVSEVRITPESANISDGDVVTLTATVLDPQGNTIIGRVVTWSISNASVATVDDQGRVTAKASGNAQVVAETGGVADTALVNVSSDSTGPTVPSGDLVTECANPGTGWIWCDDFEQDRLGRYFEYDNPDDSFARTGTVGVDGSYGMRVQFAQGQTNAGSLKLAFGRTPDPYMRPVDAGTANYRELYWRVYVRNAPNWTGGGGDKLSRAISFAGANWSEAMIAHIWSGGAGSNYLVMDPASGTDAQGNVQTREYNDFANLRWMGARTGTTPIFDSNHVGQWSCVETHVRLNDAGQANGVFEFWINGELEARRADLNWVGSYDAYGINALFLENYWNDGSPQQQERYFDNLVVSTQRVGCGDSPSGGSPEPAPVASVNVSPSSVSLPVDGTVQLSATPMDVNGQPLTGRPITWSSNNTAIAIVSSSGLLTAKGAGSATITATSEGKSASAAVNVSSPEIPGTVQPWLYEDFSSYSSTANLLENPKGTFATYEDINTARIHLDQTTGYGNSIKSMRYDFPDQTGNSNRCHDYSISRMALFPQQTDEVWIELYAKFSADFTTVAPASWNCASTAAYKFVFGAVYPASRFQLVNGVFGDRWDAGYPGNEVAYVGFESGPYRRNPLWDGQWHRYRFHWKASSAGNGVFRLWIDNELVIAETGVRTTTSSGPVDKIYGLILGRNINQGPDHPISIWWGRIAVWNQNPGW